MSPLSVSLHDFDRARRRAFIQQVLGLVTGRPPDLLPFGEVRQRLRLENPHYKGLQEVPLDRIVGSVGRYQDFTRTFLPRRGNLRDRWATVQDRVAQGGGLPPVDLFQVGDAYFVRDGHHRVSVARARRARTIQAFVWEYETKVPLEPDTDVDALLLKQEYLEFLERTHLDELRPDQHIALTAPGAYRELLEHIDAHQRFLESARGRTIPYKSAVASWYDTVYLPVVEAIRQHDVLRHFPRRTEADLYIWVSRYQRELCQCYDYPIPAGAVVTDWAQRMDELAEPYTI